MTDQIKNLIEKFIPQFEYNRENDVYGKDADQNVRCDLESFMKQLLEIHKVHFSHSHTPVLLKEGDDTEYFVYIFPQELEDVKLNQCIKITNLVYEYATINWNTEAMIEADEFITQCGYGFCVSDLEHEDGTISEDWHDLFRSILDEMKIDYMDVGPSVIKKI